VAAAFVETRFDELAEMLALDEAVSVGTSSNVLESVVWLTDTLAVSFTFSVAFILEVTGPLTGEAVAVAGYICASSTITSAGRSLYHCGVVVPVGRTMSVPVAVGMAVLRTERTESLVGSMVAGSMARARRSTAAWGEVEARALARSAVVGRIVDTLIFTMCMC
jgi:hypothetical protein